MRKLVGLLAFAVFMAGPAFAQSQQQNPPTTQAQQGSSTPPQAQQGSSSPPPTQGPNPPPGQKNNPPAGRTRKKRTLSGSEIDVSAGATFNRYTAPAGYYLDMVGWTGSANYDLFRWLSAQAEASGDYSHKALIGSTMVYTLLAGPQFFPLRRHKVTPWGHFLFGQGYYRDSIPSFGGFPAHVNGAFAFAWEGGVGLDVNYKRRWRLRLLEFDYTSTNFFGGQPHESRQSNYRLGVGVIYRIGRR
jgi:hypothetical protein